MGTIELREIDRAAPPMELLLLADPSLKRVQEYLRSGRCHLAFSDGKLIGEFILIKRSPEIIELINIAVVPESQGKGIGKALVKEAKRLSKEWGGRYLEVGTGNSSIDQLAFYQKCGFQMMGIEKDFFVNKYDHEIEENGIICRDMVRLSLALD